ncbi:MAG: hypothetical protein U1E56_00620 [Bauldia sp.]
MTSKNPADERLRGLLGGLSPAARALISKAVKARPGAAPPASPEAPPAAAPVSSTTIDERRQALGRAFFEPIVPFINASKLLHRETGRLSEDTVAVIWEWIARDLAKDAVAAVVYDPRADFSTAARPLRETVLPALSAVIAGVGDTQLAEQRLAAQIGGDRGHRDLAAIEQAFREIAWVAPVMKTLPRMLTRRDFEDDIGLLAPLEAALMSPRGDPAWLFSALLPHLESPTLLARIAVILSGVDAADAIERSPVAPALDILLSEIEIEVARLRDARAERRAGGAGIAAAELAIQRYHSMLREVEVIVDLGAASRWANRIALLKKVATAEVAPEVAETGGLTRRVFRLKGAKGEPQPIDAELVEDADRALRFLKAAANARESFALNAVLASVSREVEQTFEMMVEPLLQQLRNTYGDAKARVAARAEAVLRLAETYFGPAYAATLRRSVALAGEERSRLRG